MDPHAELTTKSQQYQVVQRAIIPRGIYMDSLLLTACCGRELTVIETTYLLLITHSLVERQQHNTWSSVQFHLSSQTFTLGGVLKLLTETTRPAVLAGDGGVGTLLARTLVAGPQAARGVRVGGARKRVGGA